MAARLPAIAVPARTTLNRLAWERAERRTQAAVAAARAGGLASLIMVLLGQPDSATAATRI